MDRGSKRHHKNTLQNTLQHPQFSRVGGRRQLITPFKEYMTDLKQDFTHHETRYIVNFVLRNIVEISCLYLRRAFTSNTEHDILQNGATWYHHRENLTGIENTLWFRFENRSVSFSFSSLALRDWLQHHVLRCWLDTVHRLACLISFMPIHSVIHRRDAILQSNFDSMVFTHEWHSLLWVRWAHRRLKQTVPRDGDVRFQFRT